MVFTVRCSFTQRRNMEWLLLQTDAILDIQTESIPYWGQRLPACMKILSGRLNWFPKCVNRRKCTTVTALQSAVSMLSCIIKRSEVICKLLWYSIAEGYTLSKLHFQLSCSPISQTHVSELTITFKRLDPVFSKHPFVFYLYVFGSSKTNSFSFALKKFCQWHHELK